MTTKVKLTKSQKIQLKQLQLHYRLFVGYNSPSIMKTFETLVDKGLARIIKKNDIGKWYEAVA